MRNFNDYHLASTNQRIKPRQFWLFILVFIALTSCSSQQSKTLPSSPDPIRSSVLPTVSPRPANSEVDPNTLIDREAINKNSSAPLVVESSQGITTIGPVVVSYPEEAFSDPLEFINRPIFVFNDAVYSYAFIPLSKLYMNKVPNVVRSVTSNFFLNIGEPFNAVNHLLQLEGASMGTNISRFLINTTIGILGLFDPAQDWFNIKEQDTGLNETLIKYDVGYGAYLVLPLLGQTDIRNGFSTLAESITSPINAFTDNPDTLVIQAYGSFNDLAPSLISYEKLSAQLGAKEADHYQFFRNLYLQSVIRDEQFKDGQSVDVKNE